MSERLLDFFFFTKRINRGYFSPLITNRIISLTETIDITKKIKGFENRLKHVVRSRKSSLKKIHALFCQFYIDFIKSNCMSISK